MRDKVYIIAEAGVNHDGDTEKAMMLCRLAKESGADAVKFQTWRTELLLHQNTPSAEYQKENLAEDESQFEMLKKLELSYDSFRQIKAYCDKIGIEFLSTPDEEESLDFLVNDLGLETIKIGSAELRNIPFLTKIASYGKDVILSTGMGNQEEISTALSALRNGGAQKISILHCVTEYPAPFRNLNLRSISALAKTFDAELGYSDHSVGIEASIAAVTLGARIIEKHFTYDKSAVGPDHKASIEPDELKALVDAIRNIEIALGDDKIRAGEDELKIRDFVEKKLVALRTIEAGMSFSLENVGFKRAQGGISVSRWDDFNGKVSDKTYNEGDLINE